MNDLLRYFLIGLAEFVIAAVIVAAFILAWRALPAKVTRPRPDRVFTRDVETPAGVVRQRLNRSQWVRVRIQRMIRKPEQLPLLGDQPWI